MSLRIYRASFLALLLLVLGFSVRGQQTVRYELYVRDTLVHFAGKEKRAIAVNGQLPMPTLTFTEGDTAEIVVHNQLRESTSLHWHGVWLPNKEDGVPHLTQQPIASGKTHTYRFPIIQNGSYWYHSHSGLQEQIGMYGSMVFHKRKDDPSFRKGIDDIPSLSLLISEWTNLRPHTVDRMLHTGNDWFSIQKNTVQSYAEAIQAKHFKTKLRNEWKRMEAMDVSDVYYEKFLINGLAEQQLASFKAGDKVRLRIANAGASSYFWLTYAGGKIRVVANDGNDVEPVEVDRLLIGVSETYDILLEIPAQNTAYELLATAEDRTGSSSFFLGAGRRQLTARLPRLQYFEGMKMMNDMMKMNGDMHDMGMQMSLQQMDMNAVMYPELKDEASTSASDAHHAAASSPHEKHEGHAQHAPQQKDKVTLNYGMLRATSPTTLDSAATVKNLRFELTGNMNRYVWSMDNRVLSETDKIPIKKGEVLRIVLYNNSMMRHPMHLHGFDFRVLNKNGDYAPLKNVLDIMPMETDTIEFAANRDGDWFFHCHILYHMMAGMNRVFAVGDYQNPLLPNREKAYSALQKESNMWHFMADNDFASNGNDGSAMLQNARWSVGTEWRLGYNNMHGYEVETHVGRYIGKMQWLMPFVGFDWRYRKLGMDQHETNIFGQTNKKDSRQAVSVGAMYTLPFLINVQAEVYHDGIVRLALMREDIPISRRLRGGFMWNTDREYMVDLRYILHKNMGVRTHYDSDMGFGVGLALNY
ncbi:multicopper oxidase domain-containing protein [Sphingobacterium bambusae]|uniref:Multicopper oxidase domain-containing protein n=1 Tax=Sphingobacterium bambusae TaxID=662858 RepID=A0ABW6BFE0_9SPHI|nr:multicopper oxidase domain-containing protein [Sphingobacterium bambusae]WPL49578.1 multicopper oxidase domain-containing protein [Sphingobacterium bambusae]